MALMETDALVQGDLELGRVLRAAMAGELDATNLYNKMIQQFPQYRAELTEIMNDEIEHTGKLLALLCQVEPDYEGRLNRGIDGQ